MSGFKPFLPLLPEIELPLEKLTFDDKVLYTVGSAFVFLLAQLPIYGLKAGVAINDPFYFIRSVFANEKGTLLELGVLAVLSSGLLWQTLSGLRLLNVNFNVRYDRELFQSAQKLTAILLSVFYALCLVVSGYYTSTDAVYGWSSILIILQISSASFIITLLSEIIDKGYGFGSGALALATLNISSNMVKDFISFETVVIAEETETVGAFVALIKSFRSKSIVGAVVDAFTRSNLPNLSQFFINIIVILGMIGIQNFRIELPIRSTRMRGMANVFPIKLLFVGALPIVFTFAVLFNLHIVGFTLFKLFPSNAFIQYGLGNWTINPTTTNYELTSGLLYFLSPSNNLLQAITSPIRTIVYAAFIIGTSTWFGNLWCKVSGSSPKDIASQFKEQGVSIAGKRDISITKELSRVIPVAAVSGSFVLAATAVATEFVGGLGKGVAMIVAVCSAFGILEEFMIDFQQQGSSQFASVFR